MNNAAKYLFFAIVITIATVFGGCNTEKSSTHYKLLPPEQGIYHSAYPDFTDSEDNVTAESINEFIQLAGKGIVWAYFSNNWINGIQFPRDSIETIHNLNIIPYVRLMARSTLEEGEDPVYNLQEIIDGRFDTELRNWAAQARDMDIPIVAEFGTEVNGSWFGWCGVNNGGGTTTQYGDRTKADGPERFVDAYRHIIDLFREVGANNITWVFHVDAHPDPDPDSSEEYEWNRMANYYPGDDYIDWIGISVYGAIDFSDEWESFTDVLDAVWDEFSSISNDKPLAILEWGVMDNYPGGNKAQWITDALNAIKSGRYNGIKAISYWNEAWEIEPYNGYTEVNLRIDSSTDVLNAYRTGISSSIFVDHANIETW